MKKLKIAILCMQKNENFLLKIWHEYYSKIFSPKDIFIFDNGSNCEVTLKILEALKKTNTKIFTLKGKKYFNNKGNVLLKFAYALFATGYNFAYFCDIDEFHTINESGKTGFRPEDIYDEFQRLYDTKYSIFRIGNGYLNIAGTPLAYADNFYSKKILLKDNCSRNIDLDLGFHLFNWSKREDIADYGKVYLSNFSYIHFHNKLYDDYVASAREKLDGRVKNFDKHELINYTGAGVHLVSNMLLSEENYYDKLRKRVNANCVSVLPFFTHFQVDIPYLLFEKNKINEKNFSINRQIIINKAQDLIKNKKYSMAELLYEYGEYQFNDDLDEYGRPIFVDKHIRLLLLLLKWGPAKALISKHLRRFDFNWLPALFARSYVAAGQHEEALFWWLLHFLKNKISLNCVDFTDNTVLEKFSIYNFLVEKLNTLKKYFGENKISCMLDVGSNMGMTTGFYLSLFGFINIHCFEPSLESYEILFQRFSGFKNIYLNNCSVSEKPNFENSSRDSTQGTQNILKNRNNPKKTINSISLSDYCQQKGIDRIDLLVCSANSHELDVLRSLGDLLSKTQFIDMLIPVCKCNSCTKKITDVYNLLSGIGFRSFGIYEYVDTWTPNTPAQQCTNFLFINDAFL